MPPIKDVAPELGLVELKNITNLKMTEMIHRTIFEEIRASIIFFLRVMGKVPFVTPLLILFIVSEFFGSLEFFLDLTEITQTREFQTLIALLGVLVVLFGIFGDEKKNLPASNPQILENRTSQTTERTNQPPHSGKE